MSPGRTSAGQPVGDREQQLVADLMAVGVVDLLEPVEVGEQDRGVGVRALGPLGGVLESFLQQQPVRQPGQRVVQRDVVEAVGGRAGLLAGLGVEQVGSGHVRQRLGGLHVVRIQGARRVAVEVQRAEPALPPWRNGNVNTAASPAAIAAGANSGNRSSLARSGTATASPDS